MDPDFEEIGKSGRLWTRGEMITALVTDTDPEQHSINFSDMSGRTVGWPGLRAPHIRHGGRRKGWRVLHHQGTPIP
ncbi:MAG TPA: hypothetical protein VIJ07_25525 [Dermatophilaceae bacterium]